MNSGRADQAHTQVDWERHFNPRVAVPNFEEIMSERKRQSELTRNRRQFVANLRYGEAARSTLDVFPANTGHATVVYIHGGYWRAGAANDNSAIAEHFCRAGVAVFLINYTLCPDSSLPKIVDQIAQALTWIKTHGRDYGATPDQLYLCGTSAGAHLAAMLLAHDATIAGACLISGIYDLAPVLEVSVNADIGLTRETAQQMSPMNHLPIGHPRLVMAVGEHEPSLWTQQSRDYSAKCIAQGLDCNMLEIPGANHFSVAEAAYHGAAPIAQAMKRAMGLVDEIATDEKIQ